MEEEVLIKALDLNNSANKVEFSSSEKRAIRENTSDALEELDSRVSEKSKVLERQLRPYQALQDEMQDYISELEADVGSIPGIIEKLKESYDDGLGEFYESGSLSKKSARKLDDLIQKLESAIGNVYDYDGLAKVAEQRAGEFWRDKDGGPEQQTETQIYKSSAKFDYGSKLQGLKDAVRILKTVDIADLEKQMLGAKLLEAFVEEGGEYDDEETKIQELLEGFAKVSEKEKLEIKEQLGVHSTAIKRDAVIGLEEIFNEKVDDVERFVDENVVVEAEKKLGVERVALNKLRQVTDALKQESRGLELLNQNIQSFCEEVNALADKNFNYREIQQILTNIKVIQNDLKQVDYFDTAGLLVMVNEIAAKIANTSSLFAEKTTSLRLYDLSKEERDSLLALSLISIFPKLEELDFSHNNDISIEEWADILDKVSEYSDLRINIYNTILSKKLQEQGVDFEFGQTFTAEELVTKLTTWNVDITQVREERVKGAPKDRVQYLGVTGLKVINFGDNTILKSLFSGFDNLKQLNFSNTEIYDIDMLESILDPLQDDILIKVSASDKEDLGLEKEEFTKAEYYQYKARIQDQIQEEAQNQAATQIQKMIRGFQARKEAERLKNERMESIKNKGGIDTDKIERVDSLRHDPSSHLEVLSTQVDTDDDELSPKSNASHGTSFANELEGMDIDKHFAGPSLADELREEGVHLDQYFKIESITPSEMDLVESRAVVEDVGTERGEIVTTKVKGLPKDKFESRLDIDFDGDIQGVLRKLAYQLNVQLDLNQSYVFPPTIIFGSDFPLLDRSASSESSDIVVKDKGQMIAKQELDKRVAEFLTQSVSKNNGIILPIRMGGQDITEAVILNRNARGDYYITYIGDLKSPICELIYRITTSLEKSNVNVVVNYFDVNLMKNGHSKQTTVLAGMSQAIRGMASGKALEDAVQEHDVDSLSLTLPEKDRDVVAKLNPAERALSESARKSGMERALIEWNRLKESDAIKRDDRVAAVLESGPVREEEVVHTMQSAYRMYQEIQQDREVARVDLGSSEKALEVRGKAIRGGIEEGIVVIEPEQSRRGDLELQQKLNGIISKLDLGAETSRFVVNPLYVFPPVKVDFLELGLSERSASIATRESRQLRAVSANLVANALAYFEQDIGDDSNVLIPISGDNKSITEVVKLSKSGERGFEVTYVGDFNSPIYKYMSEVITQMQMQRYDIRFNIIDINFMRSQGHDVETSLAKGMSQAIRGMASSKALEDVVSSTSRDLEHIGSLGVGTRAKSGHSMRTVSFDTDGRKSRRIKKRDRISHGEMLDAMSSRVVDHALSQERALISTHRIDKPKPSVRDMSVQTEPYMPETVQKKKVKHGKFTSLVTKVRPSDSPIKDKDREVIQSIYERISFNHAQEYMKAHHFKEHEASLELYKQSASCRLPDHIDEHLKRVKIYEEHYILEVRRPNPKNVKEDIYKNERKGILKEVIEEITENQLEALTMKKGYREYDIGQDGQQLILRERLDENGKISFNLEEIIQAKGTCSIAVPRLCPDGNQAHDVIEIVNGELRTFVMSEVGESKIKEEQMDFLLNEIIRQQPMHNQSSSIGFSI